MNLFIIKSLSLELNALDVQRLLVGNPGHTSIGDSEHNASDLTEPYPSLIECWECFKLPKGQGCKVKTAVGQSWMIILFSSMIYSYLSVTHCNILILKGNLAIGIEIDE